MPVFPGDNLNPRKAHGDLLVLVQSDHAMVTHHALRDVMRRTKGRLEGRWAQSCFQRFTDDDPATRTREGKADARGLLGFNDGSQNILAEPRGADLHRGRGARLGARRHLPSGAADPAQARAVGPSLADGPERLDRP